MRMRTVLALLLTLALAGCEPSDPRRIVAEEFIDRLFVLIDQKAARDLASGLAIQKLDDEIRLKEGQKIDAGTRQPQVSYSFLEAKGGDTEPTASLVYELHVRPDGAEDFSKRLFLTLRQEGNDWRVSNYNLESAPPG